MLAIIIFGFIFLALFNLGVAIGLSVLTFTLSASGELPFALLFFTGGAPTIHVIYLLMKRQPLTIVASDFCVTLLFAFRFFSLMFLSWPGAAEYIAALKEDVFGIIFYIVGRLLFVQGCEDRRFVSWLNVTLLLVFPIYILNPNMDLDSDRLTFVGAEESAVGLSLVFNVQVSGAIAAAQFLLFTSDRVQPSGISFYFFGIYRWIAVILCFMIIAGGLVLLGQNGTRGAIAGILVSSALLSLMPRLNIKSARSLVMAVAALTFSGIVFLGSLYLYVSSNALDPDDRFDRFADSIAITLGIKNGTISDLALIERENARAGAIDLVINNPIFGCGTFCTTAIVGSYPHNLFLELFAEQGVFGFILIGIISFMSVSSALKALLLRNNVENVIVAAIFISIFVQYQASFSFSMSRLLMFFAGCCISMGVRSSPSEISVSFIGGHEPQIQGRRDLKS